MKHHEPTLPTDVEVSVARDAEAEGRWSAGRALRSQIVTPPISIPTAAVGLMILASVSGGKDSTALILALLECVERGELPRHLLRFVFADTGWEADETYEYLDFLRKYLGIQIDIVGADGGMVARVRHRTGFPGRMQRFCTRELKLEPLRGYHDRVEEETGLETVSVMGVRAAESESRSKMPEWEDEGPKFTRERWGGYVWRPMIRWSIEDVLRTHQRHRVPVNPLYLAGFERVGCYPCIFENKEGIRLIAQRRPQKIDQIRDLEAEMRDLRVARNLEQPGRYARPDDASFFQTQRQGFSGIDKVVEWARTEHGGKQMPLFAPAPKGGCMRWGLCEMPAEPTTEPPQE